MTELVIDQSPVLLKALAMTMAMTACMPSVRWYRWAEKSGVVVGQQPLRQRRADEIQRGRAIADGAGLVREEVAGYPGETDCPR